MTLSDGAVSLCQSSVDESDARPWSPSSTATTTELATHSLEPWTLAFSPDTSLLFSGGDDAVLQALKLPSIDADPNDRSEDEEDDDTSAATLLWTDRKSHEAGVTSILPLANDSLITGSYDDRIRLLSAPAVGRRKILAELDLGGGVWRLKMLSSSDERYVMLLPFCFAFLAVCSGFFFSFSFASDAVRRVYGTAGTATFLLLPCFSEISRCIALRQRPCSSFARETSHCVLSSGTQPAYSSEVLSEVRHEKKKKQIGNLDRSIKSISPSGLLTSHSSPQQCYFHRSRQSRPSPRQVFIHPPSKLHARRHENRPAQPFRRRMGVHCPSQIRRAQEYELR